MIRFQSYLQRPDWISSPLFYFFPYFIFKFSFATKQTKIEFMRKQAMQKGDDNVEFAHLPFIVSIGHGRCVLNVKCHREYSNLQLYKRTASSPCFLHLFSANIRLNLKFDLLCECDQNKI